MGQSTQPLTHGSHRNGEDPGTPVFVCDLIGAKQLKSQASVTRCTASDNFGAGGQGHWGVLGQESLAKEGSGEV
jgi:hypothetical protein